MTTHSTRSDNDDQCCRRQQQRHGDLTSPSVVAVNDTPTARKSPNPTITNTRVDGDNNNRMVTVRTTR